MNQLRAPVWLAAFLLCGCLDADASEPIGYSPHLLDDDADIPHVEDDMLLAMRIGNNDAVDPVVPLRTGYAAGKVVQYWDFGIASSSPEPVWLFRRRNADGEPVAFGHPDLIDTVPGDMGYSPIRSLFIVYVTREYQGEQITSAQALEDAIELGLVEEPMAMGVAGNWPVVLAGTTIEVAEGDAPIEPEPAYYHGRLTQHVRFGGMTPNVGVFPLERGSIVTPNAYVLRRQNEVNPLDEAVWKLDLNSDEDMTDSNVVFSREAGQEGYVSLWQRVEVVVPSDYEWGTSQAEEDLFVKEDWGLAPKDGAVVEYAPTAMMLLSRHIRYVAP
jgi:hypothetical protein